MLAAATANTWTQPESPSTGERMKGAGHDVGRTTWPLRDEVTLRRQHRRAWTGTDPGKGARQKCSVDYRQNPKKRQQTHLQNRNRLTDTEHTLTVPKGERQGRGVNQGPGSDMHVLLRAPSVRKRPQRESTTGCPRWLSGKESACQCRGWV